MMQNLAVEQDSTGMDQHSTIHTETAQQSFNPSAREVISTTENHALHCSCLVSESTIFIMLMSAHHSLKSCSPLKRVFGKIGDTYQAYCNTYKTHAMATCHGGLGQPLNRDIYVTREAHEATYTEDMQDFHPVETDCYEDLENINPVRLTAITRDLDDLCQ